MIIKFLICTLILLKTSDLFACLRTDIEGRAPAEVLKKATSLAHSMRETQTVVAIWINDREIASGIALDPYTILTAGHSKDLTTLNSTIKVRLASNAQGDLKPGEHVILAREVIVLPTFKMLRPIRKP